MTELDPRKLKTASEAIIRAAGGAICDWLPVLELETIRSRLRTVDEVRARALAMNALINIAFQAPIPVIARWIESNGVAHALTSNERRILQSSQDELEEQDRINLQWYLESLWALMWVGGIVETLRFDDHVPDTMVTMVPNLQRNEDGSKFASFELRPREEIVAQLDLFFRWHWHARNAQLTGASPAPVDPSVILERRKALEWVCDPSSDWDDVRLDT